MEASRVATARRLSSKHEDILRAATKAFSEAGYARASMDEIAAKAAVSKATIYSHFGNKDALFEAIIRELCERLVTPLRLGELDRATPQDTLTTFARSYIEVLLDPARNRKGSGDRVVSADEARVSVVALSTNEEIIVARRAYRVLS